MNLSKAAKIIEYIRALGVVDFCLCAGARNSPFITLLDENKTTLEESGHLFHFFDERSASFFALGRSQQSQRPVAIITTSGTAATELISAAVEAFYTKTPLIFITADRPPSYRGTGAPQSIEQLGIFSHYSVPTVDIYESLEPLETIQWDQTIPLHLNVCFAEPLLSATIPVLTRSPLTVNKPSLVSNPDSHTEGLLDFYSTCKHPLFIISGLHQDQRALVAKGLDNFSGAWWTESLSGLRGHPGLEPNRIRSGERFVQHLLAQKVFDGVIRIGSVPTTRVWRDLEERFPIPVLSLTDSNLSGLARRSTLAPLSVLSDVTQHYEGTSQLETKWRELDRLLAREISKTLESYPESQLSLVKQLSKIVNEQPLYLGNSLPVREWDWMAEPILSSAISGNRGANGIDGQISTFFGWMPEGHHSWALLGDLTTLYDLNAPWILRQLPKNSWTLVVMNNGGGHIFKPMFGREAFINRHPFGFEAWANMWELTYSCLSLLSAELSAIPNILELRPSEQQTIALRMEIENIWKNQLS